MNRMFSVLLSLSFFFLGLSCDSENPTSGRSLSSYPEQGEEEEEEKKKEEQWTPLPEIKRWKNTLSHPPLANLAAPKASWSTVSSENCSAWLKGFFINACHKCRDMVVTKKTPSNTTKTPEEAVKSMTHLLFLSLFRGPHRSALTMKHKDTHHSKLEKLFSAGITKAVENATSPLSQQKSPPGAALNVPEHQSFITNCVKEAEAHVIENWCSLLKKVFPNWDENKAQGPNSSPQTLQNKATTSYNSLDFLEW